MTNWNDVVIEQFRAGNARIADQFDRETLVILHTTGAKSGAERLSPVVHFDHQGQILVVASAAGRPNHPAWFHNLSANPEVGVEIWRDGELRTLRTTAEPLPRAERDEAWKLITQQMPGFADYEKKTDRLIPVVRLTPTP